MYSWLSVINVVIVIIVYVAFFWRVTWIKDLRENHKYKKKNLSKLISKNRKIGQLPPVYPNGWFALMESAELKRNQVEHVSVLGQNFAVFRTDKGVVNILDAYCPHLGANMAEGGQVKGDCLECPFHGWMFRGSDGICQKIPYSEKIPLIARTKAWKSCEVNGIIFVWYHAEDAEPNWQPQAHPLISNGTWQCHGSNEFLINCHIQEIPENGADIAHLSEVHGPFIFLIKIVPWLIHHSWTDVVWAPNCTILPDCTNEENNDSSVTSSKENDDLEEIEETDSKKKKYRHRAAMQLRHKVILFNKIPLIDLHVKVSQIGPGYVELRLDTAFGQMYLLQTVTPVEPLLQRVTHRIFSTSLLAPYTKIVFIGKCLMFERDVAVWNHKCFKRQPILVPEDRTIIAYRRWYSQFYSTHSPTYEDSIKSLHW